MLVLFLFECWFRFPVYGCCYGYDVSIRRRLMSAKLQIKSLSAKKKGEKLQPFSLDHISFLIEMIASLSEGSSFSIIHHIWSASISK